MKRKILSVFLAIAMLCATLSTPTFASSAALVSAAQVQGQYDGSVSEKADGNTTITLTYDSSIDDEEWQVLRLTNWYRMSIGLSPLTTNDSMQMIANQRAGELPVLYNAGHDRPDGSKCFTAFSDYKVSYSYAAENIAKGYTNALAVVTGWINSAGHRANIENKNLTHLGVGMTSLYWAQDFAGSSCVYSDLTLSKTSISGKVGDKLETLLGQANIKATADCSRHGSSYLPVIAAMCTGYDATAAGTQTLTVTLGDSTAVLTVTLTVEKTLPFRDVADHWAIEGITYAYEKGLFSGTTDTTFEPDIPMSRAMMVTVLARYAGEDTSGGETWYAKGRQWAMTKKISDGYNMMDNITREQVAAMLYRYVGEPATTGSLSKFSDAAKVSSYAVDAMRWAVEKGIINGSNGALDPQSNATRAQVATMMMRFCEM